VTCPRYDGQIIALLILSASAGIVGKCFLYDGAYHIVAVAIAFGAIGIAAALFLLPYPRS
jgi:hypothetical protein